MSISITVEINEFANTLEKMCVCGHKLGWHGTFTSRYYPDSRHHTLYVSQCPICGFGKDREWICKEFKEKE